MDCWTETSGGKPKLKGEKPDFNTVRHTAPEPLLTKKRRRQLHPVSRPAFVVRTYPLTLGGSEIEVTLDRARSAPATAPSRCARIESKAGDRLHFSGWPAPSLAPHPPNLP